MDKNLRNYIKIKEYISIISEIISKVRLINDDDYIFLNSNKLYLVKLRKILYIFNLLEKLKTEVNLNNDLIILVERAQDRLYVNSTDVEHFPDDCFMEISDYLFNNIDDFDYYKVIYNKLLSKIV